MVPFLPFLTGWSTCANQHHPRCLCSDCQPQGQSPFHSTETRLLATTVLRIVLISCFPGMVVVGPVVVMWLKAPPGLYARMGTCGVGEAGGGTLHALPLQRPRVAQRDGRKKAK